MTTIAHDTPTAGPVRRPVRRSRRARLEDGFAKRTGRKQRWGAAGVLYVVTCVFVALGAVNAQNNLLFLAFGLGLGGLLTSGVVSGASLMGLRVRRRAVEACEAGATEVIRYDIASVSAFMPALCVIVEESSPARAKRRQPTQLSHQCSPAMVGFVGARKRVVVESVWMPGRRGWIDLDAITLTTTFPFGLLRKTVVFSLPRRVLVWPARVPLRASVVERAAQGSAQGRDALRAGGEDVFGVREYRDGDAIKDIAWRATARGHAVLVRQRAVETTQRLWVALNLAPAAKSPEASPWNDIEMAVALAATIARSALDRGLAVGLSVPQAGLTLTPREGAGQRHAILDALALVSAAPADAGPAPRAFRRNESVVEVHIGGATLEGLPAGRLRLDARDLGAWCADPSAIPALLKGATA